MCMLPFSIEGNIIYYVYQKCFSRQPHVFHMFLALRHTLEWVARATASGDMHRVIRRTVCFFPFLSGSSKLTADRSTCNYKQPMKHNFNSNGPTTIIAININNIPSIHFVTMCLSACIHKNIYQRVGNLRRLIVSRSHTFFLSRPWGAVWLVSWRGLVTSFLGSIVTSFLGSVLTSFPGGFVTSFLGGLVD